MTTQDKAKELVEVFYHKIHNTCLADWLVMEKAKSCASVCIDEILIALDNTVFESHADAPPRSYWEQVKNEIQNL